jgi:hypothetical protein
MSLTHPAKLAGQLQYAVLGQVETYNGGGIRDNGFINAVIRQNFKAAVHHFHFASPVW